MDTISTTSLSRNVFYQAGVEHISNPELHYLHIGVWYTRSPDYYQHRQPKSHEHDGHAVLWLHNAKPRDRFVFLITPIDTISNISSISSLFSSIKKRVYRPVPHFASDLSLHSFALPPSVEIVEILHKDITAIDYSPGLVSTRFSIEATQVTCSLYPSENAAREAFNCHLQKSSDSHNSHDSLNSDLQFSSPLHSIPIIDRDTVTINNTVVTFYTQDPNFTPVLREVVLPGGSPTNEGDSSHLYTSSIESRQRLLGLVETGMPCWVSFCTRYGLFYRRSLRVLIKIAVNFWPLVALSLGLYDLYSHLPYVHEYLLPVFALFEDSWIFRLCLYLAYFFTYILYFMQWIIAGLWSILSVVQLAVIPFWPLLNILSPIFTTFRELFKIGRLLFNNIWQLVVNNVVIGTLQTLLTIMKPLLNIVLYPIIQIANLLPKNVGVAETVTTTSKVTRTITLFWSKVARPIKNMFKTIYDTVIHLGSIISRHEASLRMWYMSKFNRQYKWLSRNYLQMSFSLIIVPIVSCLIYYIFTFIM